MFEAFLIYIYLTAVKLSYVLITAGSVLLVVKACIEVIYAIEGKPGVDLEELGTYSRNDEIKFRQIRKYITWKLSIGIFILGMLIPSTNQMKLILGGAIAYNGAVKVSEIEGIEKIPQNLVNLANHFMEEMQVEEEQ